MSKLLSTYILYPTLTAIAISMADGAPASANPRLGETTPGSAATTPAPLKVTNSLANNSNEVTSEQVERATTATEIKPDDWAYQTLQGLQAKYGCRNTAVTGVGVVAGNENRILSREEFATSLNGCVRSIEELVARKPRKLLKKRRVAPAPAPEIVTPPPTPEIAPPPPEPAQVQPLPAQPEVSQQDLDQLKQLVQSFSVELQGINARLQALDSKIATVNSQSFSTTTKLVGEVIFALSDVVGDKPAVPSGQTTNTRLSNNQAILSNRVRLNFRSSFMGKDLLITRLQARNSNSFSSPGSANTNMVRLGFEGNDDNNATLHLLQYQLPVLSGTKFIATAVGNELDTYLPNFNTLLAPAATGAVTRFGRYNSIYRLSGEGAGATLDQKLTPGLSLAVGYAVPRTANAPVATGSTNTAIPGVSPVQTPTAPEVANNPAQGDGLFNGSNLIFSQLSYKASDSLDLGLIYARSYHSQGTGVSGFNGSGYANNPFASNSPGLDSQGNPTVIGNGNRPVSTNHYSFLASNKISPGFVLSGWVGYANARREGGAGNAEIWDAAVTAAFPDFGAKGNLLGFVVGLPPKLTGNTFVPANNGVPRVDRDTAIHLEAFYKYQLNDNISITPGVAAILNPENNAANPILYLGTVRTTFSF